MSTPEYQWALQKLSLEKRHESGILLSPVKTACLHLSAAELFSIRDQLIALEPELIYRTNAVQQVLADLKKGEEIMVAVSGSLATLERIATLT